MLLITTDEDVAFRRDDVLVAAADPTGATSAADLLADDHVTRYIDGWGRSGDVGLIAHR